MTNLAWNILFFWLFKKIILEIHVKDPRIILAQNQKICNIFPICQKTQRDYCIPCGILQRIIRENDDFCRWGSPNEIRTP